MQLVCCIEFVRICQVFFGWFLGKIMETGKVNNNRCETVKIGNVIRLSVVIELNRHMLGHTNRGKKISFDNQNK